MASIEKLIVQVTIVEGQDLVAKDRNFLGKRTTSDPYCELFKLDQVVASHKTSTQYKNLNPQWNETFIVQFQDKECRNASITIKVWDDDKLSAPDAMGAVTIPIPAKKSPTEYKTDEWYTIPPESAKNAKGSLHVVIDVTVVLAQTLIRGNQFPLNCDFVQVGLAWDMLPGRKAVDLDVSCVAISTTGQLLMTDTVYYGNVANSNESVLHSGDEQCGDEIGDDEKISFELRRIPPKILCMYILLTVATPDMRIPDIESATMRVYDTKKRSTLCKFTPASHALSQDATAMFMVRLSRSQNSWTLAIIEDTHPTARDFGSLIPYFKSYTYDLIPTITVDPTERVAIMRKGGNVRLRDYTLGGQLPSRLTFGLAWDVTDGVNIDLDASAVCFDAQLNCVDVVCSKKQQLQSKDGSIVHHGDEKEGDEIGDDETIGVVLDKVNPAVHYIAFVINSYSGQELDDVDRASCHLFDPATGAEILTYAMSHSQSLDGYTALLVGCLYRSGDDWGMCIISEAAMGKLVDENVDDLIQFLKKNTPQLPPVETRPEVGTVTKSRMPMVVPLLADD